MAPNPLAGKAHKWTTARKVEHQGEASRYHGQQQRMPISWRGTGPKKRPTPDKGKIPDGACNKMQSRLQGRTTPRVTSRGDSHAQKWPPPQEDPREQ